MSQMFMLSVGSNLHTGVLPVAKRVLITEVFNNAISFIQKVSKT